MIPVTFQYAFFIYLLAWIIYLIILWGRESLRTNINEWSLSDGKLCVCDKCGFAFISNPRLASSECPKCKNICLIKKEKHHVKL